MEEKNARSDDEGLPEFDLNNAGIDKGPPAQAVKKTDSKKSGLIFLNIPHPFCKT
jgi:hypothetical protein